jgi:branched-chain amino acid transport system ATP-binding protein
MHKPVLHVSGLTAFYGNSQVLRGVDFDVGEGEIVALLGRNGSGRSTTAKAIMGLVQRSGSVRWNGTQTIHMPTYAIARAGIGYVPEGRDIFPALTLHQNLQLGERADTDKTRWTFEDMYRMFPSLKVRQHTPAGVLSGGEQQMLSLCRCLMGNPRLVIVDEPAEGLAPQLVEQLSGYFKELRRRGVSVLLIEQKLAFALDIADRCLVMGHGQIVFNGAAQQLSGNALVRKEWLEI